LQLVVYPFQTAYLGEIAAVLEQTLANLPAAPLAAADNLESAWQMLAVGLPVEGSAAANQEEAQTPTPTPFIELTPTPTPFFGQTPTSTPFFTPTPTP